MSNSCRIQPQRSLLDVVHRLIDAASIALGLWLAVHMDRIEAGQFCLLVGAVTVVLYYLAAEVSGLYGNWHGVAAETEIFRAIAAWGATLAMLLAAGYFLEPEMRLPRAALLIWCLATPVALVLCRMILRGTQYALRSRGLNTRNIAIVGINELGFHLARNIESSPHLGLKLAGFYDDRPGGRLPALPEDVGTCLGDIELLIDQARQGQIDMVYVTFPMRAEARIQSVLNRLADSTASVYVVPDFFVFELLHSRWTNIGGLPAVSVFESPFYGVDGLLKRMADVCLATLFLAAAAIPMMLIAGAVKLSSPGPVFFRQKRYGLDGRSILVWKFRSMRVCEDGPQVAQATQHDPRVTRVGAFLRRTSLDELPQLFNVLEGNMSLVGPRPHANAHNETFRKQIQGYMLRHKVKPGITGLAQVNGWRGETDTLYKMKKRVDFDHQYIREWSPWLDVKILFQTVFTVLSRQNAY